MKSIFGCKGDFVKIDGHSIHQKEFASILNAKFISYNCGHYIHHYKSDEMCEEIIDFVNLFLRVTLSVTLNFLNLT